MIRKLECKESDFTPLHHGDGAKEKMRFANQFCKFVMGGFQTIDFQNWFYIRLSMTFGHVANYNLNSFYNQFFLDARSKVGFIRQIVNYECYGDPAYTYSDVEKIIQKWLDDEKILVRTLLAATDQRKEEEKHILRNLIKKYAPNSQAEESALKILEL